MIIFCVFSFYGTDYFHYMLDYEILKSGYEDNSMEDVYIWIVGHIDSYTLFRLVVWGSAIWLCSLIPNRVGVNRNLFIAILALCFITKIGYARASLAMAMMFCGLAIYLNQKSVKQWTLGVALIAASFFFHKSAFFGIAMIILALATYKMDSKKLKFIAICYPFFVSLMIILLKYVIDLDPTDDSMLDINAAQNYMNKERVRRGIAWGPKLGELLFNGSFYVLVYVYIKAVLTGAYKRWTIPIKIYSTAFFWIVAIATIFAFDLGANTSVYYYRLLYFAMIPAAVFLCHCWAGKFKHKTAIRAFYLAFFSVIYQLTYTIYLAWSGEAYI